MSKLEHIVFDELSVDYRYYGGRKQTHWEPEEYEEIEIISVYDCRSEECSEIIDFVGGWEKLEERIFEQRKLDAE